MGDLWARLGVTVKDADITNFMSNPKRALKQALEDDRVVLDGESYFPPGANEELQHDNKRDETLECQFSPTHISEIVD